MLRNALEDKTLQRKNPYLSQIDALAIACADAEKLERKRTDQFLLKKAAISDLQRRMREGEEIHTSEGARYIDRVTGKEITETEMMRVQREFAEAEHEYLHASQLASQARGRLNNAQKGSENWLRVTQYHASQAEQLAAETPAERERREKAAAYQRDIASR